MATFLERAKDQYYADQGTYQHFGPILDAIARMHVANSYYKTDLFNIEEILSILEMQTHLSPSTASLDLTAFTRFIADVIRHYTPPLVPHSGNDFMSQMTWGGRWRDYGPFTAMLLGYNATLIDRDARTNVVRYRIALDDSPSTTYSVVSLNYDLVLETLAEGLAQRHGTTRLFSTDPTVPGIPLAKLHGSVDTGNIVPPTWSKGLTSPAIGLAWKRAYELLRDANEIRIVGYSLPDSDNYVRYLLRAAAIDSPNLKAINAFGLDKDGTVKHRFEQFITHRTFRFQAITTETYLLKACSTGQWPDKFGFQLLEDSHRHFFSE